MKISLDLILIIMLSTGCSQQPATTRLRPATENLNSIVIDSTISDSIKKLIDLKSDRYFSDFRTPIDVRFFEDDLQTDSIIENSYNMMSWYSIINDTIDLVCHVTSFEAQALLVRFINGVPTAYFFRAPHDIEGTKKFKINLSDSFASSIEVAPIRLDLRLSRIPDSISKPEVFGYVEMESGYYYDRRDSAQRKRHINMKFNFRSQHDNLED